MLPDNYESPIFAQLSEIKYMVTEEYDRQILKAVGQVGIQIDKDELVKALNADHERYTEAYQKGWSDCKRYYEERLREITELAGKAVDIYG